MVMTPLTRFIRLVNSLASTWKGKPSHNMISRVRGNKNYYQWEAFVTALQICFKASSYDDPIKALISVKQTTIVEIYKTQCELLSNRVKGLSESHKLSCFLGGLKEEIRMGVQMLNPQNLVTIYELARMQEDNLTII